VRRLAIGMLTLVAGLTLFGPSIQAQDDSDTNAPVGRIDVLQVSGYMDPILVDAIDGAIDRAVDEGSQALILQVNSDGTVVGDEVVGTGEGRSKKAAEQQAAEQAWNLLTARAAAMLQTEATEAEDSLDTAADTAADSAAPEPGSSTDASSAEPDHTT